MKNKEVTINDVTEMEGYVSPENAQLLKEKGFNELCLARYIYGIFVPCDSQMRMFYHRNESMSEKECTCPTIQMVLKWLREMHDICISVDVKIGGKKYYVCISSVKCGLSYGVLEDEVWDTFEEACEESIKYCLENLL